jgi:hypothetical protein
LEAHVRQFVRDLQNESGTLDQVSHFFYSKLYSPRSGGADLEEIHRDVEGEKVKGLADELIQRNKRRVTVQMSARFGLGELA